MKRGFLEKLIERIRLVQPSDVQNYLVEIAREKGLSSKPSSTRSLRVSLSLTSAADVIIYLNRAAGGFFGIEADTSLGKLLGDVIRGLDLANLNEVMSRDLEGLLPRESLSNFTSSACERGQGGRTCWPRHHPARDHPDPPRHPGDHRERTLEP